jgi:hypothetical protein
MNRGCSAGEGGELKYQRPMEMLEMQGRCAICEREERLTRHHRIHVLAIIKAQ